ncbi:MAG TPA: hypothetical protein VLR47_12710, partial [Rhodospirillales bacterium]|nr:hypothetical protein [Rhodospirillales bacterium]
PVDGVEQQKLEEFVVSEGSGVAGEEALAQALAMVVMMRLGCCGRFSCAAFGRRPVSPVRRRLARAWRRLAPSRHQEAA